jgi:hypothetical protein
LQTQLLLRRSIERRRVERLGGEPSLEHEPLEYIEHQRALERIGELEAELAAITSDALDFEFEGVGVYDHGITMSRLGDLISPIGRTIRNIARDIATLNRDVTVPGQQIGRIAEPVLLETFQGSFGIRIVRSPVAEQPSLDGTPSLFDRTADRIISVFRSARDTREPITVLDTLSGFRSNAMRGVRDLAQALTSGGTTLLRWRGEEVIAITPGVAGVVFTALNASRIEDDQRDVTGELMGGDLADARFHIRAYDPRTGRERDYRGGVEPAAVPTLRSFAFGNSVTASLTVTTTDSEYFATPRETYVLTNIRLASDELQS